MGEHSPTVEVYYDGAWHLAPVLTRGGFTCMRGAKSVGNDTDPASGSVTIDNTSGDWAPKSATSRLRGKIGQNTKARMSLDGSVCLTGEVASWKPERPIKGSSYTPIQVAGVLQRIGRGTDPLRSPLVRATLATGPVAFWPLEDGRDATSGASLVSGGTPLARLGTSGTVVFGGLSADLVPGGLTSLPSIDGAALGGSIQATSTTSWRVEFLVGYNENALVGLVGQNVRAAEWTTGGGITNWWVESGDGFSLLIGSSPYTDNIPFTVAVVGFGETRLDNGQVHHITMDVTQLNSTQMQYLVTLDGANVGSGVSTLSLGVQQVGPPSSFRLNPNGDTNLLTGGGIAVWSPSPASPASESAVSGYAGELATTRFTRLCLEEGITSAIVGDPSDAIVMGPQTTVALLEQLDEIANTDDASIFETKGTLGLTMRTGASKLNQTVALSLSYLGQVLPPLRPVYGDTGIRNDVSARNVDGTVARRTQDTGPHNTQLPENDPQGVGRYNTSVSVNTTDLPTLTSVAGWRVNLGTYDGTWYAEVTADLDAAPGLVSAVNAVDIGDVVEIRDLPAEDSLGSFLGIVLGIQNDAPPKQRKVTFYLAAADPYRVGKLAQTTGDTDPFVGYVETDGSTTAAAVAAGAASFTVATPTGFLWTTLADDFPQDVVAGGQRVSISAISGASSPQTFTVQSTGRQVVYPIDSGADVHVWQPIIIAQ